MNTDSLTPETLSATPSRKTPWGAIIGILLILVIVVTGAYYALTDRLADMDTSEVVSAIDKDQY